jgi:hypothetical protein
MYWKDLFRSREAERRREAELKCECLHGLILTACTRTEFSRISLDVMDFNAMIRQGYRTARRPSLDEFWFTFYRKRCLHLSNLWAERQVLELFDLKEGVYQPNEKYYL